MASFEGLKQKMIRISSEDKTLNSVSNSRFQINLNQNGTNIDSVAGYQVKYVSCPNIFPNVPAYANTLQIIKQIGLIVYNINLDVGQYLLSDFITELQTKINIAITPASVIVTSNSQGQLNFLFSADNWELSYSNSTIKNIIGLSPENDNLFFNSLTLSNPVNLTGETELYIHSKTLNNGGLIEPNGAFSVVDVLSLSVPYGGVAYSDYNNDILHQKKYTPYESLRTFRTLDIVLRNRSGEVLSLPNNFYFNMILLIYYK